MKKIILILLLIYSSNLISQNCKYKINEIDEFTKHKILETKPEIFTISGMGFGFSTSYSLKKINDNKYLNFSISSPSNFTLREESLIMFKTNEDKTINLSFPETITADYISGSKIGSSTTPSRWIGNILIPISEDNYQRFLNEKVLKLRVYTGDGYIDDDIKEKRAIKFQILLKCIE